MKKKNIINLIKYHINGDEQDFKNEAYEIAHNFQKDGDDELARYIMALLSDANTFTPQSFNGNFEFFTKINNPSDTFKIPQVIEKDILGILNAVNKKSEINKFLFVGDSGTGKTEAAKQIARILERDLYMVQFDRIIDSKLGQTAKNLIQVFDDINALKCPEKIIILFDEIDALALDRVNTNDLREMGRVTSTLLKEFDRLDNKVMLIATTNLYKQFDKALLRRFDFIVDFNRYKKEDLEEIADALIENELKKYPNKKTDKKILHKIYSCANKLPYPGDLKNIIRSSIAFSDTTSQFDYLNKIFENLTEEKTNDDLKKLQELGFTIREIEKLTGIPKSSVSREINNEWFTRVKRFFRICKKRI